MIKTLFTCAAVLAALSGCMTPGASGNAPGEVPASRIFIKEITAPTAGPNEVKVTRDPGFGFGGGNNLMEFAVNYVALADLQPGESISAWLPDGTYTFTVKPKPNQQNVAARSVNLTLRGGQRQTVRIGGTMYDTIIESTGSK